MTYVSQVGGEHYDHGEDQHWDLMDRWDIEYLVATASKYVVRYDRKGTATLDLQKSISYLQKQLACHPNRGCRRAIPADVMSAWSVDLSIVKRSLLRLIHVEGTPRALRAAIKTMEELCNT